MVNMTRTIIPDTGRAFMQVSTTISQGTSMTWPLAQGMQPLQPDMREAVAQQIIEEFRMRRDDLQLAIICALLQEIRTSLYEMATLASEQIQATIGGSR